MEFWQFTVIFPGHEITGGVTSCTVIDWMQVLKFPQLSVAFQVREMTWFPVQLPAAVTSEYVITGDGSQLSVAVAIPVVPGEEDVLQLMVISDGQLITGAVRSRMVIVCGHVLTFPQLSTACQVRVTI